MKKKSKLNYKAPTTNEPLEMDFGYMLIEAHMQKILEIMRETMVKKGKRNK